MAHLSTLDLNVILSGLKRSGEHCKRMQVLCPDQYDFYEKEYEQVSRIYDIVESAQDRVYRSENLSARINVKL